MGSKSKCNVCEKSPTAFIIDYLWKDRRYVMNVCIEHKLKVIELYDGIILEAL
jgi:hypothetical protein